MTELDVPPAVAQKARLTGNGQWLRDLPRLVEGLERDWSIRVGTAYPDGTEAFVANVTLVDGGPGDQRAVLKLIIPRGDAAEQEITVLRLAAGGGCARLLRDDVSRGAMLMERLGPSLSSMGLPQVRRQEIMVDAARRVWRAAPGVRPHDVRLPDATAKVQQLTNDITRIWEQHGRPCQERTVTHALVCAQRRLAADDPGRAVLLHGDVHEWNTMRSGDGFKLVDPDGVIAEPAYELGVLIREDPEVMLAGLDRGVPREQSQRLSAWTGVDETAIWEWGVLHRVATGLVCLQLADADAQEGPARIGRAMLRAADQIAAWPA